MLTPQVKSSDSAVCFGEQFMCTKIIYVIWRHSFIRLALRHGFGPALRLCPPETENSQHSTNLEWESWLTLHGHNEAAANGCSLLPGLELKVVLGKVGGTTWSYQGATSSFLVYSIAMSHTGFPWCFPPNGQLEAASGVAMGQNSYDTASSPGRIPHCWLCCKIWRKCHLYNCRARLEQRWRPDTEE